MLSFPKRTTGANAPDCPDSARTGLGKNWGEAEDQSANPHERTRKRPRTLCLGTVRSLSANGHENGNGSFLVNGKELIRECTRMDTNVRKPSTRWSVASGAPKKGPCRPSRPFADEDQVTSDVGCRFSVSDPCAVPQRKVRAVLRVHSRPFADSAVAFAVPQRQAVAVLRVIRGWMRRPGSLDTPSSVWGIISSESWT